MQFFTSILALATTVSAINDYTLFCGDSCTTGQSVSVGTDYSGASCTNLDNPQAYCYLVSDIPFYKAIVSRESGCVGTNGAEQVVLAGECFEGPWESYQVSVDL